MRSVSAFSPAPPPTFVGEEEAVKLTQLETYVKQRFGSGATFGLSETDAASLKRQLLSERAPGEWAVSKRTVTAFIFDSQGARVAEIDLDVTPGGGLAFNIRKTELCTKCLGSGKVAMQHPLKPPGIAIMEVDCPDCKPGGPYYGGGKVQ